MKTNCSVGKETIVSFLLVALIQSGIPGIGAERNLKDLFDASALEDKQDLKLKGIDGYLVAPAHEFQISKGGMLPMSLWFPTSEVPVPPAPTEYIKSYIRPEFIEWKLNYVLNDTRSSPPNALLCWILFNPHYKFLYVKNPKVGGTSFKNSFGDFCSNKLKDGEDLTLENSQELQPCFWSSQEMARAGFKAFGYDSWEQLWESYTVVTLTRNPYDRAGSSYEYVLKTARNSQKSNKRVCTPPSFEQFTSRPYSVGLQDEMFGCGQSFNSFAHVQAQSECLLTESGELVVDYIIRLEELEKDLLSFISYINNGRKSWLPELKSSMGWDNTGASTTKELNASSYGEGQRSGSRYQAKYETCGSVCTENIESYFVKDFVHLQYPMISST